MEEGNVVILNESNLSNTSLSELRTILKMKSNQIFISHDSFSLNQNNVIIEGPIRMKDEIFIPYTSILIGKSLSIQDSNSFYFPFPKCEECNDHLRRKPNTLVYNELNVSFDYKELLVKSKERFLLRVKKSEKRTQVFQGEVEMETKVFHGFFYCDNSNCSKKFKIVTKKNDTFGTLINNKLIKN
jgi:hypothetical protein